MSRWGLLSLSPFSTVSPSLTASPMPWIKQISVAEATGFLKQQFDAAIKRAGRVWHIVHIMSLNARVMKTSIDFYGALLFGSWHLLERRFALRPERGIA